MKRSQLRKGVPVSTLRRVDGKFVLSQSQFLQFLSPETAHRIAVRALRYGLAGQARSIDRCLAVDLWGYRFPSPLGIAAGFDKQGQVVEPLLRLGFGFVEVGTLTPRPQAGNAKPRVFRAPAHRAIINRYGFNSDGYARVLSRLTAWRHKNPRGLLGVNLGINKGDTDPVKAYIKGIQVFENLATYLVVNLSSPNTEGLRDQQTQGLPRLIEGLQTARTLPVPLLLKVAPDLQENQVTFISDVAKAYALDGLIVSNTTLDRPDYLPTTFRKQAGGLSGAPLRQKSLFVLKQFAQRLEGQVPLIGVGGIMSGSDAVARLRAGADLLQVYTGFVYSGPEFIDEIYEAIVTAMCKVGATSPQRLKEV